MNKEFITTEQGDTSSTTHTGEEITSKENSSFERTEIEGTPFSIITTPEGHFLCMGRARLTGTMKEKADIIQHLSTNMWEIVLTVILVALDNHKDWVKKAKTANKKSS